MTRGWIALLEVRAGIEPTFADLQSAASPLCHRTDGCGGCIPRSNHKVKRRAAGCSEPSTLRAPGWRRQALQRTGVAPMVRLPGSRLAHGAP